MEEVSSILKIANECSMTVGRGAGSVGMIYTWLRF